MSITGVLIAATYRRRYRRIHQCLPWNCRQEISVRVDEKKKRFSQNFRVTTVVDVDMPDVPVLQQLSQRRSSGRTVSGRRCSGSSKDRSDHGRRSR